MAASHARLTPSSGLRNLLSRPRLAELLGQDEPVAWLSGDIRRNTTLYPYLRREHGVEELTAASFLGSLDKRFLEAQPDGWIRRLYEFLHRERGEDAALGRALDDAWGIPPLVRLEDGTHTEPEDWSGDRLFLPTDPPLGLPNTVLPAVCDSEPALAFLKSLGVSEPDLVDELIPDVVDRYRDQSAVDPSAHPDDLRRIVEVFTGASRFGARAAGRSPPGDIRRPRGGRGDRGAVIRETARRISEDEKAPRAVQWRVRRTVPRRAADRRARRRCDESA